MSLNGSFAYAGAPRAAAPAGVAPGRSGALPVCGAAAAIAMEAALGTAAANSEDAGEGACVPCAAQQPGRQDQPRADARRDGDARWQQSPA